MVFVNEAHWCHMLFGSILGLRFIYYLEDLVLKIIHRTHNYCTILLLWPRYINQLVYIVKYKDVLITTFIP